MGFFSRFADWMRRKRAEKEEAAKEDAKKKVKASFCKAEVAAVKILREEFKGYLRDLLALVKNESSDENEVDRLVSRIINILNSEFGSICSRREFVSCGGIRDGGTYLDLGLRLLGGKVFYCIAFFRDCSNRDLTSLLNFFSFLLVGVNLSDDNNFLYGETAEKWLSDGSVSLFGDREVLSLMSELSGYSDLKGKGSVSDFESELGTYGANKKFDFGSYGDGPKGFETAVLGFYKFNELIEGVKDDDVASIGKAISCLYGEAGFLNGIGEVCKCCFELFRDIKIKKLGGNFSARSSALKEFKSIFCNLQLSISEELRKGRAELGLKKAKDKKI